MDELSKQFPPGVEYKSIYDTTVFVRDSIKAVVSTPVSYTHLDVYKRQAQGIRRGDEAAVFDDLDEDEGVVEIARHGGLRRGK